MGHIYEDAFRELYASKEPEEVPEDAGAEEAEEPPEGSPHDGDDGTSWDFPMASL